MEPANAFKTIFRLRFRDQDVIGHANNAVYFTFFEDVRADFLREHNLDFNDPEIFFILAKIGCEFKKPIVYDFNNPYIAVLVFFQKHLALSCDYILLE